MKRLVQLLIVVCLLFVGGAQPAFARVPPADKLPTQTPRAEPDVTTRQTRQGIPGTYELVGESPDFELYANEATLAFKVVDKRSGYIWSSNLDEVTEDDKLNKTWTAFASSGISIEYLDQKAVNKRLSITNSATTIDFQPVDQGFEASVTFTDVSITIPVMVKLEAAGVSVAVPFESIKEESVDYKLNMLHVYPFLGATKEDTLPGYMFIPDGSGSIIRFAATTKAQNMFYGRYYGPDLGMITSIPWDPLVIRPYNISIPVFGMVHGEKQNAFISIVEKGAAYGQLMAHPAGVITRFNFLYTAFIYNESYFQATSRSGDGVTVLQHNTNAYDVLIHYRFLTGDEGDYVGMARSYQQYLVEKGILRKITDEGQDIGMRLEFLGGDKQKVLVWYRFIPMTTISQIDQILDELAIQNLDVVYYGWQPLGASTMPPENLKLERKLGSLNELKALIEKVTAAGGNFYLYLDPQAAMHHERGYSPRYDLAMSITNQNIWGHHRNIPDYFLNLDALTRRYSSLSQQVFSELQAGLALDDFGSLVYSDFKDKNFLNREDAIGEYQDLLAGNDGNTSFYIPNDYMFGHMQAYYDIPLGDSGYIYTTEAVPFIQIALAGYVPFYGTALNFSSNLQDDLLRHVDFDVYPSYFLTNEVTAKILDTRSNWIYTSSYDQWGESIKQTYAWLNNLLGPVKGQEIIARQELADGVVATTYSNGIQIIVNYNDETFYAAGYKVEGKDAITRQVVP